LARQFDVDGHTIVREVDFVFVQVAAEGILANPNIAPSKPVPAPRSEL
jgi:hypothetical protein